MTKGVSVRFRSYDFTIPKLLQLVKLENELKKYKTIILKPSLNGNNSTPVDFVEQVLKYCLDMRGPQTDVFIADGADGVDTMDMFEEKGYKKLSEKYGIGLIDLNNTETKEVQDGEFLKFDKIMYPKILEDSFIISLSKLVEDPETEVATSLANMLGAFPARFYSGFFSSKKSKIRKWPIKYSIHDILKVKMPQLAIIDASEKGAILIGKPFEVDRQSVKLLGKDWKAIGHLRLIEESFSKALEEVKAENPSEMKG